MVLIVIILSYYNVLDSFISASCSLLFKVNYTYDLYYRISFSFFIKKSNIINDKYAKAIAKVKIE